MEYSSVINEALRVIKDPSGNRWTKDEVKGYIDIAQRRLSASSLCLEGSQHYTGDSTLENNYPLPDDFLEFVSFILPNGSEADLISTKNLNDNNTYAFLYHTTSTSIQSVCLDFGSWNEVRFYPNPIDGVDIGILKYKRLARNGMLEIEEEEPLVYFSLFRMWLKERSKEGYNKAMYYFDKYTKIERSLMKNRKMNYRHRACGSFF